MDPAYIEEIVTMDVLNIWSQFKVLELLEHGSFIYLGFFLFNLFNRKMYVLMCVYMPVIWIINFILHMYAWKFLHSYGWGYKELKGSLFITGKMCQLQWFSYSDFEDLNTFLHLKNNQWYKTLPMSRVNFVVKHKFILEMKLLNSIFNHFLF